MFAFISLDSNCCKGRDGSFSPYYLLWLISYSSGINVFAQPMPVEDMFMSSSFCSHHGTLVAVHF